MVNQKRKGKKKKQGKRGTGTTTSTGMARPRLTQNVALATKAKGPKTHKAHVMSACSILDPFCVHAKGAKRPDGLGTNTLTFQVRDTVSITTSGTSGRARTVFAGGFGIFGYAQAAYADPNFTLPATWTQFASSTFATTNGSEVRLVSFGIRLISVLSATNSQGYVILGTMTNPVVGNVQSQGRTQYPESSTRPLTAGFETSWISKPTGAGAHNFHRVAGTTPPVNNAMNDFDWTSLSVEIVGGPTAGATTCLVAEIFANIEIAINETAGATGYGQLIAPAKPANPVALTTQAVVQSKVPSLFDGPVAAMGKFIEQKASSVIDDALSGAMAFLELL